MKKILMTISLALIIGCVFNLSGYSQSNEITYQGNLNDNGTVASGNYDFQFRLFNVPTGGTSPGGSITKLNVPVSDGVFTVGLNTGTAFAAGSNLWLEIAVRQAGGGSYTTLSPRQFVTSSPYSIRSLLATNATQLGGVTANQFVLTNDARLSDARMPTAGSGNYIQNTTNPQTTSNFSISGTGKANIMQAETQFNLGADKFIHNAGRSSNTYVGIDAGSTNPNSFNSFFGNNAGSSVTLLGSRNSFFGANAGKETTSGINNSFLGFDSGQSNIDGINNTLIGANTDVGSSRLNFATAIGVSAVVTSSNTIQLGRDGSDTVRVGKLGTAGSTSLCLNASKEISNCSSSARYKSNITDFNFGLSLIKKLRPVSFNWKDGGALDFGLVAEEVAQIEPLLIITKDGKIEGIKYDRIGIVLINAVMEQQTQIEEQQAQIEELQKHKQEQKQALNKQQSEINQLKTFICSQSPEASFCKK